jgi:amidase
MIDFQQVTLSELQEALSTGETTSVALTQAYLDRIETLDRAGPALNAIREVNGDALEIAATSDRERAGGQVRSPLHGIPILLKDNIGTADGMRTTVGVHALADLRTPFDAHLAVRLRAAGAILIGKANCPDFCDYMASTMPSSHSTTGGTIGDPYGIGYQRGGGSSTGVASAVAAGLVPAGIGSETQNSIQAPCSNTSVVGIKPTLGLVSRSGVAPLAITQDTAGPIARTVKDAAMLLSIVAGPDFADSITLGGLGAIHRDYSIFCDRTGLVGTRIGIPRRGFFGREGKQDIDKVVEAGLRALHDSGALLVDPAEIPSALTVMPMMSLVFRTDFKAGLNAFLRACGPDSPVHTMADIVVHNLKHGAKAIPFGQDLLLAAEATAGDWSEPAYHRDRARDIRLTRAEGIDAVLQEHRLDALAVPMDFGAKFTGKAGYPAVTVPCGYCPDGSPVGITFIGTAWSEPKLISIAYAFEQETRARRAPLQS